MQLIQKDKKYIWHPFTQMKTADAPIPIAKGEGVYLFTPEGDRYLDAVSSWWVNIHGHANKLIAKAIYDQALTLEHVIFAGFTHSPAVTLAERVLQLFDGAYSKVFYTDNGSTAVEVGIKMAVQYWHNLGIKNKTKLIAIEDAYHGDTFGSMSVSGRSAFNAPFDSMLFDVKYIPLPTDENIDHCCDLIDDYCKSGEVAAFVFEPLVQGAGGMRMYSPEHLSALMEVSRKNKVLTIADEVMTGWGRTGRLFATDHIEAKADIICLSKGITGGFLPLAITLCSDKVFQTFYDEDAYKALYHGHSYTANPIACAAANASLDILLSKGCDQRIQSICFKNQHLLNELKENRIIADARQTGTILAFELKSPEGSSYFSSMRKDIYDLALKNKVLLRPLGNVMYFMPPYCISDEEIDSVHQVMKEIVHSMEKKYF